ncbi:MAG TPA: hypothetical protein VGJ21_15125, partial [Terracidiphilus sp.]
ALKRQVEDDFRLDMSAIERLQRRFMGTTAAPAYAPAPAPAYSAPVSEPAAAPSYPEFEARSEPQQDELTGTLRSIFSSQRR